MPWLLAPFSSLRRGAHYAALPLARGVTDHYSVARQMRRAMDDEDERG